MADHRVESDEDSDPQTAALRAAAEEIVGSKALTLLQSIEGRLDVQSAALTKLDEKLDISIGLATLADAKSDFACKKLGELGIRVARIDEERELGLDKIDRTRKELDEHVRDAVVRMGRNSSSSYDAHAIQNSIELVHASHIGNFAGVTSEVAALRKLVGVPANDTLKIEGFGLAHEVQKLSRVQSIVIAAAALLVSASVVVGVIAKFVGAH